MFFLSTLIAAAQQLEAAAEGAGEPVQQLSEAAADKGYHSNPALTDLAELELRGYFSEPLERSFESAQLARRLAGRLGAARGLKTGCSATDR